MSFAPLWRHLGWPLVALVAVTALVFGYVGFDAYFRGIGIRRSFSDLFYLSIQLFVLESGSRPEAGTPWQLEIARLAAPLSAATALAAAVATVFRGELDEIRLRRRSRHAVICGIGERGARLATALAGDGYHVTAIERDGALPVLDDLRRRGMLVVVGDGRRDDVLRRAGVHRASFLITLTGSDEIDADVAVRGGTLADEARLVALTCLTHVRDPDLCAMLRCAELSAGARASHRLEFFNVYEQGARAMLDEVSPSGSGGERPAILVVGLDALGQSVLVEAARRWATGSRSSVPLVEVAVDPNAGEIVRELEGRYPALARAADLRPVASVSAATARTGLADAAGTRFDAVYVCSPDDTAAVGAGLRALHQRDVGGTPVVVGVTTAGGLAGVLERATVDPGLRVVPVFDRALTSELLSCGTCEVLARAIHSAYRSEQLAEGATAASNPSVVRWEELPETLRESNRDQAAHIGTKLASAGLAIAPSADWDAAARWTFSSDQVERLARMEHERWMEQRRRAGATLGPKRADGRTTPYLVPWDHLSEDARELDRRAVRSIPALLAKAGYRIVAARGGDGVAGRRAARRPVPSAPSL